MQTQVNGSGAEAQVTVAERPASLSLDLPVFDALSTESKALVVAGTKDKQVVKVADTAFDKIRTAIDDPESREVLAEGVRNIGSRVQMEAVNSSGMLKVKIGDLAKRSEQGSDIANQLINLRSITDDLDPGKIRTWDLPGILEYLLGGLPFFGPNLKRYMNRFQNADVHLKQIDSNLGSGAKVLEQDNITLDGDRKVARERGKRLAYQAGVAIVLREKLQGYLETLEQGSDERTFVEQELMFPLNQRLIDLLTSTAVEQQGVVSIDMVRSNNRELVSSVGRARTVTMRALDIGITIAVGLSNQKKVYEGVRAANEAAGNIIASNAKQLRNQGAAIHKQAASSMIDLSQLKGAWVDLSATLKDIEDFRKNALPQMAQTILEFNELAEQGEATISRIEKGQRVRKGAQFLELDFDKTA